MVTAERYYHPVDPRTINPGFVVNMTDITLEAIARDRDSNSYYRYSFFRNARSNDVRVALGDARRLEKEDPNLRGRLILGAAIRGVDTFGIAFDHKNVGLWKMLLGEEVMVPIRDAMGAGDLACYPDYVRRLVRRYLKENLITAS